MLAQILNKCNSLLVKTRALINKNWFNNIQYRNISINRIEDKIYFQN